MGLKDITKDLQQLDKDQLLKLIAELYKKFKPVREYFEYYSQPDEQKLYEICKQKVLEGFYPKRGYRLSLATSKKAISDFKKYEPSNELVADLMLYYVECGVEFTNDYGDIDEPFYMSVARMFDSTLRLLDKEQLLEKYKPRAKAILEDTNGIGWGFHDDIGESYYTYYKE